MKKHMKLFIALAVILLITISFIFVTSSKENNFYKESTDNIEKRIMQENTLSMMLETEEGSGNYEMTTASSWPTDGYVFNETLSKCENGGELSWDDEKKVVLMSGNVSDKCYVYFDKYVSNSLADFVVSQYNGIQGNNNIYYHDSSLENGAGDNSYRYAGASDSVNNYVCFGSSLDVCPDDNLYRIIGVFDGKIKLVKAAYASPDNLGTDGAYTELSYTTVEVFRWTNLSSCSSSVAYNDTLNVLPLSNKNSIAYVISGCYKWNLSELNTINLNKNFLNNFGVWASKISTTRWNFGGNTSDNINAVIPSVAYQNEHVDTTNSLTYDAKVGLMYVSDYEFAAAPDCWSYVGTDYSSASSKNWIYLGTREWLITPRMDDDGLTFTIEYNGSLASGESQGNSRAVRPTFFLEDTVIYKSGEGTKASPIIIE